MRGHSVRHVRQLAEAPSPSGLEVSRNRTGVDGMLRLPEEQERYAPRSVA